MEKRKGIKELELLQKKFLENSLALDIFSYETIENYVSGSIRCSQNGVNCPLSM